MNKSRNYGTFNRALTIAVTVCAVLQLTILIVCISWLVTN